ncbi:MAG: LemA family protein [Nanoarchaeota archaeon]|nr:LemA family protein [Nanoarchaeota archaeon]
MAKKINKNWIIFGGIGLFVLIIIMWLAGTYNSLITLSETVDTSWAQVENQYQRRADLIPNLVSTVKGYAAHEKDLFTEITKLRSQWGAAATKQGKIQAAQGMEGAISRLLLVAENYPQLKANENFLALQAELSGTENRVAVERKRYNDAVRLYNIKIKRIPTVFIANWVGYEKAEYFEVEEGKEAVPEVDFN